MSATSSPQNAPHCAAGSVHSALSDSLNVDCVTCRAWRYTTLPSDATESATRWRGPERALAAPTALPIAAAAEPVGLRAVPAVEPVVLRRTDASQHPAKQKRSQHRHEPARMQCHSA